MNKLPLEGVLVLEFAQFMAGPSAGLKLADLGARVVKIERPTSGESGRQIDIKNIFIGSDSLVFHTINRNKQSYAANLKDASDLEKVKLLIRKADVMTHNFRPGVMKKLGLDYDRVKNLNPRIIYGEVSGYGSKGPWALKPGQDLLIQSLSGLAYLTGNEDDDPTPMGIAASDMFCGAHFVQGLLAALINRQKTGMGSKISVSLLESTMDLQFELITTYLNDNKRKPVRAKRGNAHAYMSAPYGVYKTKAGYIALAMNSIPVLADCIKIELDQERLETLDWNDRKNKIIAIISQKLEDKTAKEWVDILQQKSIWCSEVYTYKKLLNHPGYVVLKMDQEVETINGEKIRTTRCPIQIDGEKLFSRKSAPLPGEDNRKIELEFDLK